MPCTAHATRARRCCGRSPPVSAATSSSRPSTSRARILDTLRRLKPDRPLPSNVEFFAGVVMASAGLPRALFTPTFAVSRSIAWVTHAVEQAAIGKLIRPSARYVGPPPTMSAVRASSASECLLHPSVS